jgi:hypothetical protein
VTLFEILQKEAMDINYCLQKATDFKDVINNKRTDFDKFWAQLSASHKFLPKKKEQAIPT